MAKEALSYIRNDLLSIVPKAGTVLLIAIELFVVFAFSFLVASWSIGFAFLFFAAFFFIVLFVNDHTLSAFSFWVKMKKDTAERLSRFFQ